MNEVFAKSALLCSNWTTDRSGGGGVSSCPRSAIKFGFDVSQMSERGREIEREEESGREQNRFFCIRLSCPKGEGNCRIAFCHLR